jgi:hypothetical protein
MVWLIKAYKSTTLFSPIGRHSDSLFDRKYGWEGNHMPWLKPINAKCLHAPDIDVGM